MNFIDPASPLITSLLGIIYFTDPLFQVFRFSVRLSQRLLSLNPARELLLLLNNYLHNVIHTEVNFDLM